MSGHGRAVVGRVAEVAYVALAGCLPIGGMIAEDPRYFLAAVIVTLPLGIAAIVGVYVGAGLITVVGGVFAATESADGSEATWLAISLGVLDVALFAAAAAGNLRLLRSRRQTTPGAEVPSR